MKMEEYKVPSIDYFSFGVKRSIVQMPTVSIPCRPKEETLVFCRTCHALSAAN